MKKAIGLILAIMMLMTSVSMAEDLSALTDGELKTLILSAFEELQNRGLNYDPETAVRVLMDEEISNRVLAFMIGWGENRLDDMLEICDPDWKAEQENPKGMLFWLMGNRTPLSFTTELFLDEADGTRTAVVTTLADIHNGKDPKAFRYHLLMKKAQDRQWYVDPQSLRTEEAIETYEPDVPTPAPEAYDWAADETLQITLLSYVPQGGEYYHLNEDCPRVAEKYRPMRNMFAYQDLNYEEYADLKPCEVCGAPPRDYAPTELTGFIMKVDDNSGLEQVSYLRADCFVGDEIKEVIYSCPNEGEACYRFQPDMPEKGESVHILFSYGISELAPEDAILAALTGTPAEEHPLTTLDLTPEAGKSYCMCLEPDGGDGFQMEFAN